MWGGVELRPSLSEGVKAPKVVRLALVEKVQFLRGGVSLMHAKGLKSLSMDLKGLGVRCSGTS
jgi:hypothetical protein